ncbi:hypothetical protein VNO77_41846 [Canavalia gladiata]|uniref:Uncharacterized protein n=1 Tax=Canavalia gladiata TaxID=3824 RepID=A0AAN9K320_CANGL
MLGERRGELVTSLQLLGDYEDLLNPPQPVTWVANQAAAKAILFISGHNGYLESVNVNDLPTNCSGSLRHLIIERSPLTPPLINVLVTTPATSLSEIEEIFEFAINDSDEEKIFVAAMLCGASLVPDPNNHEFIKRTQNQVGNMRTAYTCFELHIDRKLKNMFAGNDVYAYGWDCKEEAKGPRTMELHLVPISIPARCTCVLFLSHAKSISVLNVGYVTCGLGLIDYNWVNALHASLILGAARVCIVKPKGEQVVLFQVGHVPAPKPAQVDILQIHLGQLESV